jgi:major vault protein
MESLEHQVKIDYDIEKNSLEIQRKEKLSDIETKKFQDIISTLGAETLVKISEAGPEAQVTLLQSLGLEGFIMTDGNNPINLYNFANSIAKSD